MKEIQQRSQVQLGQHLLMLSWVVAFALATNAQTSRPSSGVLLSPQRTTILSPSCQISQLQLRIRTGNDDLRGGGNNLNVEIHFADGTAQFANNVNKNGNWANNSINTIPIQLNRPVGPSEIKQIRLIHLAQGGYTPPQGGGVGMLGTVAAPIALANGVKSEDNWDMAEFQANGIGNNSHSSIPIASFGLHRFTGSNPSLDINARSSVACAAAGQVTGLNFTFKTGNDDLRGGNDNLNITVQFADGTVQSEMNANQSQRWADGNTNHVSMVLNHPVTLNQIRQVQLQTTFQGGSGGDNWNMDSVEITAFVDGKITPLATSGFHRFSADQSGPTAKLLTIGVK